MSEAKTDIRNREDIKILLDAFYTKAMEDEVIGFFFTEIIQLDLEKHMPTMYDFWESTLFQSSVYQGNPIKVHQKLDAMSKMKTEHFERWISLFKETVDEHFSGSMAETAKQRAQSIATVMQIKLAASH